MSAQLPAPEATTVRVRLRPRSTRESEARCVEQIQGCSEQVSFRGSDSCSAYTFDKVYGENSSQAQVFDDLRPIVQQALKGYNGTIMAYGQTGSGKTHTLIGSMANPWEYGIVPRAISCLAEGIAAADEPGVDFQVRLSVVEIYCERIRDLLEPDRDNLHVKQDGGRGVYIEGATEMLVTSEQQLVSFMHRGLSQRAVAATSMNAESSRSHCIVTVLVEKTCSDGSVQCGKLVMVDLAGSERTDKTHATGATLLEGSQINKSLSCLANVIYALTDDKARHVPYRDSKLTRVLQDSLGGSAKTVLIICCSPCADNAAETLSSLRFGSRSRGMTNAVVVNQRVSVGKLQAQLEAAKARNAELVLLLEEARTAAAASVAAAAMGAGSNAAAMSEAAAGAAAIGPETATGLVTANSPVLAGSAAAAAADSLSKSLSMSKLTASAMASSANSKFNEAASSKVIGATAGGTGECKQRVADQGAASVKGIWRKAWVLDIATCAVSIASVLLYMAWEDQWRQARQLCS